MVAYYTFRDKVENLLKNWNEDNVSLLHFDGEGLKIRDTHICIRSEEDCHLWYDFSVDDIEIDKSGDIIINIKKW